jgi:hypothetical protein
VAEQGRDVSDDGPRFDRHFLDHVPGFRHSRGVTFEERLWYVRGSRSHLVEPPVAVDTLAFHRSWPEYAVTPLVDAPGLAPALGVRRVLLKDESRRLGLPAFKALGITWAVGRVLGDGSPLPGSSRCETSPLAGTSVWSRPPTATTAERSPGWRPYSAFSRASSCPTTARRRLGA